MEENFKKKASTRKPFVGMTGFEPATTRPPAECATGLRHIPKKCVESATPAFCQSGTPPPEKVCRERYSRFFVKAGRHLPKK